MKHTVTTLIRSHLLVFVVGIACVLLTSLSVFHTGFFPMHDFTHAGRIAEMYRSLLSFEFPVRWSQNFGFGYGMPLFNFYGPLPYYLAQIPYVFLGVIGSMKALYVINGVLSFVGMYLLAKKLWGNWGGIISATVFSFATYRAVDLYVRGAIGEAFALAFLPFALYGIMELVEGRRRGIAIAAISSAAAVLSHNLTGFFSIPFLFVFAGILVFARWVDKKEKAIPVWTHLRNGVFFLLLAIGLSAFYTLPAFFEKDATRVEAEITTGNFDFHNHFVALRQLVTGKWGYGGSIPGLEDGMSYALGMIAIVLFVGAATVLFTGTKKQKIIFLGVTFLFGIATLMTTNKSQLIWENLSLLKFVQFPWRFLTFSHVFLSLGTGAIALLLSKHKFGIVAFLGIIIAVMALNTKYFAPERFIDSTLGYYYGTDPQYVAEYLSLTLNDYVPPQIKGRDFPPPVRERLVLEGGEGSLQVYKSIPTEIRASIRCADVCVVGVNIFSFPGWTAYVNGMPIQLEEKTDYPTYFFKVPAGEHDVIIRLERTSLRSLSEFMSVMAILVLLNLALISQQTTSKKKK